MPARGDLHVGVKATAPVRNVAPIPGFDNSAKPSRISNFVARYGLSPVASISALKSAKGKWVRDFKPRIVYPYHYSNGDITAFVQGVGDASEVRVRRWY